MTGFYEGSDGTTAPIPHKLAEHEDVYNGNLNQGSILEYNIDSERWEPIVPNNTTQNIFIYDTVFDLTVDNNRLVGDFAQVLDYDIYNNSGVLYFIAVELNTATADGGSYIDGTGVQWKQLFPGGTVTVKQFGAVGDGLGDDTAAINAAIDYMRGELYQVPYASMLMTVDFPPGRYNCLGSIDATGMRKYGWGISGRGAIIHSHAVGFPALDMYNSRFARISDIQVWGDATNSPAAGIAVGRNSGGTSAGEFLFDKVDCFGTYTVASFYAFASEINTYLHCSFKNEDPSATSYCLALDGTYKLDVASDFETMPITEVASSFIGSNFITADIRKTSGPAVYCRRTIKLRFEDSYMVSADDAAVVLDCDDAGFLDSHFEMHTEVANDVNDRNEGLQYVFRLQGYAQPNLRSFYFRDNKPHCSQAVFDIDTAGTYGTAVTAATFTDSVINVANWRYTNGPQFGLFRGKSVVSWQGAISLGEDSVAHQNPLRSVGAVEVPVRDEASYGTGTHTIISEDKDYVSIKGNYKFYGSDVNQPAPNGLLAFGACLINGASGLQWFDEDDAGGEFKTGQVDRNIITNAAGLEHSEVLLKNIIAGAEKAASFSSGAGAPAHNPSTPGIYIDLTGGATTTLYVWDGLVWTPK